MIEELNKAIEKLHTETKNKGQSVKRIIEAVENLMEYLEGH